MRCLRTMFPANIWIKSNERAPLHPPREFFNRFSADFNWSALYLPINVIAVSNAEPLGSSAVGGLQRLFLNPRFQPTIRMSLTTSQGLRRPPGVT